MRDEEAKTGKSIPGAHELAVDENGNVQTFSTMFPDKLPADANQVIKDFYGYYVTRAYHPRAINSNTLAWDSTTPYGFFDFTLMDNIDEISPRPTLLITGDMGQDAERVLINRYVLPDLEAYIVGHHGSKYSTSEELLSELRPETACISVGSNNNRI